MLDKEAIKKYFLNNNTRILGEEERAELFVKYGIKQPEKEMPLIDVKDPLAQALGAKEGDVIAFERDDYGIKYTYYRYVKKVVP